MSPDSPFSNTSSGSSEPMALSPLWLQRSGLPEFLNSQVNRTAWLVFKTVVELDCARNARPGTVEITPFELASMCGLDAQTTVRTLEGLRRKKYLALFLPEHPEETALVEVKVPLPSPRPVEEIREEFPFNRLEPGVRFRYAAEAGSPAEEEHREWAGGKRDLERVIDLYLNTVGFKINTFILDELRLICQRFEPSEVEKVFSRAEKNDIRSLGWIVKELYRTNRRRLKNRP
ncbi:hypothetical protein HQ520_02140 [bacterium]|nr:hypothetical protein [bacterium]